MEKNVNLSLGYLQVAYNDYIAARVLLNRNYTIQGAMYASTAIEKYFKAVISLQTGEKTRGHFDKFEPIKEAMDRIGYGIIFERIDPLFLEILTKAYILRYYDNIEKEPMTISFFKNQFLGELDGAVELFERLFKDISKEDDNGNKEQILSPLKMDFKKGNPDLTENNWVTMKIDKNKFMEANCEAFAIHIHPDNLFSEINVSSRKMAVPYTGSMCLIHLEDDSRENKEGGLISSSNAND